MRRPVGSLAPETIPRAGVGVFEAPGSSATKRGAQVANRAFPLKTEWAVSRRVSGVYRMAIEVDTKDCTALSDAELAEMADLCADSTNAFEVGMLSKQAEAWVLCTVASEGGKIRGFSFCTLERIGGTPSVLVGAAHICRNTKRDTVLRAIVTDQLRRSVLAFPDEDVLVGAQMNDAGAFEAYKSLTDIVPRPDHKASGEERAWGRRLAKRFGIGASKYEDRAFTVRGDGSQAVVLDHESSKPEKVDPAVIAQFADLDIDAGDTLIAFGWAMTEDLEKLL